MYLRCFSYISMCNQYSYVSTAASTLTEYHSIKCAITLCELNLTKLSISANWIIMLTTKERWQSYCIFFVVVYEKKWRKKILFLVCHTEYQTVSIRFDCMWNFSFYFHLIWCSTWFIWTIYSSQSGIHFQFGFQFKINQLKYKIRNNHNYSVKSAHFLILDKIKRARLSRLCRREF